MYMNYIISVAAATYSVHQLNYNLAKVQPGYQSVLSLLVVYDQRDLSIYATVFVLWALHSMHPLSDNSLIFHIDGNFTNGSTLLTTIIPNLSPVCIVFTATTARPAIYLVPESVICLYVYS